MAIKKIFKLIRNPITGSKKIRPFLRTKLHRSYNKYLVLLGQTGDFNRLKNDLNKYKTIKIRFGCGPRVLKDWINIDLRFEPYEKYLKHYTDKYYPEPMRGNKNDLYAFNILKVGLPLPDNSVDVIFHEDFIEHLNQKEQIIFLAETFRVMKPGAIHRINAPHLLKSIQKHSSFIEGGKGVYIREWDGHGHKNLLTPDYLKEIAKMIGYGTIIFNNRDSSISKDVPPEYRPGVDRVDDENIFCDLIK